MDNTPPFIDTPRLHLRPFDPGDAASRRVLEKFGLSAVDEEDGVVRYEGRFVIEVAPAGGVTLHES
jgi:hypothetical protein